MQTENPMEMKKSEMEKKNIRAPIQHPNVYAMHVLLPHYSKKNENNKFRVELIILIKTACKHYK